MNTLVLEDIHLSVATHFWSRKKAILRGVDLTVKQGEMFGFLGPNGSGKTTTLKIILGLLKQDKGRVTILNGTPFEARIRAHIGFMPERPYYPEFLSGFELLLQQALLLNKTYASAKYTALTLLKQVHLEHAKSVRLGHYSKGMLQRLGFAQAIMGEPQVIILDEPMSGLDPLGRRDFREMMLSLKQQGKTVIFSTHIIPDVEIMCDRIAILVDGKIKTVGEVNALLGTTASGVEVTVSYCPHEVVAKLTPLLSHVEKQGDTLSLTSPSLVAANQLIDILRQHQVLVQSVQMHRQNLEDIFVQQFSTVEHP